jgi:hypothetical protein
MAMAEEYTAEAQATSLVRYDAACRAIAEARRLADGDPEPWTDWGGDYFPNNLNRVPWYAHLRFEQRLAYLDWVIAKRQAKLDARGVAAAQSSNGRSTSRLATTLSQIRRQRLIALSDREPLPDQQDYHRYLHSRRWRRIRLRKLVSVQHRCEQPGCKRSATACHHQHYNTLGFEENSDLEALCFRHHVARHSNCHQGQQPRRRKVHADVVEIRAYADALARAAGARPAP